MGSLAAYAAVMSKRTVNFLSCLSAVREIYHEIELNESGAAKFNAFFERAAKPGTGMQAVCADMLDTLLDRASMGESLSYELHRNRTNSGNPELLILDSSDVEMTECDDDE